ncbi:Peptidoglycan-binding domain 1 protein [Methylocella tundrae]|uniref:Peptidoglycan-binding domain 1 protein n=1 Tax=Methylocella tundrae TaxID=227605 RepID=A0A8B6M7D5_METTU|nr:peptidoglycan-binding domain-containing protein [Methylocella tundrae]VTZ50243.1 Peptidoglycan-binding domain 1 protein [Methylocella tundrae]
MREALATADHDYILTEPSKPRARPKRDKGASSKRRGSSRKSSVKTRRALVLVGSALCVAALGGIAINALTMQKTRHPAPLFGHAAPAHATREPSTIELAPATLPIPAPRPQQLAPAQADDSQSAKTPTDDKSSLPHAHQASAPAPAGAEAETKPRDAITELLLGNGHEVQAAGPSKTVLAAQKALVKLGFVLKPDGVMGATTRQAIERYERDHGRASHGELTPAISRLLSAESGVPIN